VPQHNRENAIAIDVFCGAGGLSLGLAQAGFTVAAALDTIPSPSEHMVTNLANHATCAPIQDTSATDLLTKAGVGRGECTLLAGGPPCQGFSLQRRGDKGGPPECTGSSIRPHGRRDQARGFF